MHSPGTGSATVLIADDDPQSRELVREALMGAGWRLIDAADGDAAWGLIMEHQPAVVLLDLTMPGRDGLDLIRDIRADPSLNRTYVIVVTGHVRGATAERVLAVGADRYLTKPFSPEALRRAVRQGFELS